MMKYLILICFFLTHATFGQRVSKNYIDFGATAQYINNSINLTTKDGPGVRDNISGRKSWSAGIYAQSKLNAKWGWRVDAQYATRSYFDGNSRGGTVSESKPTIGYADVAVSAHYYPFWRYPVGISLFGGPMLQLTQNYRAKILTFNPNVPPPFPRYWDETNLPPTEVRIASATLGGQIGVSYQYKQFGGQVSYQKMFAPLVVEGIYNNLWNVRYNFSSVNVGVSYRLFRL
jgi:hypothetical protein